MLLYYYCITLSMTTITVYLLRSSSGNSGRNFPAFPSLLRVVRACVDSTAVITELMMRLNQSGPNICSILLAVPSSVYSSCSIICFF